MRFFYSSITVFVIANCCTFGGRRSPVEVEPAPVIISDLVEYTIDRDERDRYGLFNNINDFVSASFYERPKQEKGCKIVLITRDKRYVSWNNDPLTPTMLRDYIEHYDSISVSRTGFEEKWQIVDYDTLELPITHAEINHMAKMSLSRIFVDVSIGIGCMSCLGCFGCLVGYICDPDTPEWTVPVEARWGMLIGATIGAVASGIYMNIEQKKRARAIFTIKEMRKPQEIK